MRVDANPTELNKLGISLEQVRTALGNANANRPKGQIENSTKSGRSIRRSTFQAPQYRPLIVSWRNGAPVRLSDIADVEDSVENMMNAGIVERQAVRS